MKMPNFFIVGAPKCGTTALFDYLSTHPRVFVPRLKEPHFFAADLQNYTWCKDEASYRALFRAANEKHEAVGEASVWYLYSSVAAARIREFDPKARLIAMIRRPADMFVSLHNQMLLRMWETETDPERAWRLQGERARGEAIPRDCDEPKLLQYAQVCRLGEQLKRLLHVFPRTQVHVVVFDDFTQDPRRVYLETLSFLGIPDDGRHEFRRVNVARRPRWPIIARTQLRLDRRFRTNSALSKLSKFLKPLSPASRLLTRLNTRQSATASISSAFRRELTEHFAPDVDRLATLLGRDLEHWGTAPSTQP